MSDTITAYKGFNADWTCRGFQYEIGKTYTHDGDVKVCSAGFHACEAPLDVWNYYGPENGNQFAEVELSGLAKDREREDTKRAGKSITIKAALSIPALIKAQIEWTFKEAGKGEKTRKEGASNAASGDSSNLAASGDYSKLAASGDYSKLAASGYSSKLAASGYSSNLAASGYSSKLAASGDSSNLAASGDYSNLAASGDYSKLAASGKKSIVMAAALGCTAKAGEDGAIALAWRDEKGGRYRIAVGYVGEDGIKANTWYRAENGQLVAA